MKEAGDICVVSIPFVVGISLSAIMQRPYICSSLALSLASVCIFVFSHSAKDRRFTATVMFLCIGVFCHSAAVLRGAGTSENVLHSAFLSTVRSYLNSMPFSEDTTPQLLCALLSGDRTGMDKGLVKAFRDSGASHILALSGLHLGIIYAIIVRLTLSVGNSRKALAIRSLITVSLCGFYSAATGWSASIVRAFLFIVLNELSKLQSGRKRSPVSVYFAVLIIQLTINPLAISTVSFQLSYLAVLGIVLIYPQLYGFYPDSGKFDIFRKIWSCAALSVSCQITTAPVAWLYFRTFPKYFLLTNLISLPLAELVIVTALAAMASYALFPGFAAPVRICEFLTQTMVRCLEIISSM